MNETEPTAGGEDATIDPLPSNLDSTTSKLVYLYLEIATEATIDEIQNALGVKKITLYSLLRTLMSAGLVRRSGTTYMLHERMSEGGTE